MIEIQVDSKVVEDSHNAEGHELKGSIVDGLDKPDTQPMSKNAQKRLLKKQRFEAGREERRRRNKEKKVAKREALKAAIASGEIERPVRNRPVERQVESRLRVLIDCSFDALMNEREIKSICSQLTRCYAENRVARHPCNLIMTSWDDKIAARFHEVFRDQQNSWNRVAIHGGEYLTSAENGEETTIEGVAKEDLIYLSADSENTIQEIDEDKVYIIGGIVDKNRYKNLCQEKASKQGIKTARLPIGDYIQMASRKVLTVNHVFEIMSRWLETKDWERAFLSVIPKRKMPEKTNGPSADALFEEEHREPEVEAEETDEKSDNEIHSEVHG